VPNLDDPTREDYSGPCPRGCGERVPSDLRAGEAPGKVSLYDGETRVCARCSYDEGALGGRFVPIGVDLLSEEARQRRDVGESHERGLHAAGSAARWAALGCRECAGDPPPPKRG
jgi:hypothetical protein